MAVVANSGVPIYFGTYTGGGSNGIYRAMFDPTRGTLQNLQLVGEAANPTFLAMHPSGTVLYSVSEVRVGGERKDAAIIAWKMDAGTGHLQEIGRAPSGSVGPCHVTVHPQGRFAALANYAGGSVTLVLLDPDGRPAGTVHMQHQGHSGVVPSRQEAPHAHCVRFTPNGQLLMVTDLGQDRIVGYRFEEGKLQEVASACVRCDPGAGPRHMQYTPDGRWLVVINELANTVATYRVDAQDNTLAPVDSASTLPDGYQGPNITAEVCVHPNGRWIYGSNRGDDSLAVFELDAQSGKLKRLQIVSAEVQTPRNFNLVGESWLVVVGQDSNNACVFRIDPATGLLTSMKTNFAVPQSVCVLPLTS